MTGSSPQERLKATYQFDDDRDGTWQHPVDVLEPEPDAEYTYHDVCKGLLSAFDTCLAAIIDGDATPQEIGALWGHSAYANVEPPTIDLGIDIQQIKSSNVFSTAYWAIRKHVLAAVVLIAAANDHATYARAVALQLNRPLNHGRSQTEVAAQCGLGRAAISSKVLEFERAGFSAFVSDGQKPKASRKAFRHGRERNLA